MEKQNTEGSLTASGELTVDRVIMYCSYFSYGTSGSSIRQKFATQTSAAFLMKVTMLEQQGSLENNSTLLMTQFFDADDQEQRDMLDVSKNQKAARDIIRVLARIVEKSAADKEFLLIALACLDGILEDKRSRVKHFVAVTEDFNKPTNIIKIMNDFINSRQEPDYQAHRDIAAHIAALVIEAVTFKKIPGIQTHCEEFLAGLVSGQNGKSMTYISPIATTFSLMTIMRHNELAQKFSTPQNMEFLSSLLERPCQADAQVSYQVLCLMWILSFHNFSEEFFARFDLELIEKATKLLDFHNKEKNVRIFLMLIDNMKAIPAYEYQMSDIDIIALISKLQNRYWVDPELTQMLDSLREYFEENQKSFSSIEKLFKQVERKNLKWGPCHTEQFWKENSPIFEKNKDYLDVISHIVFDCLSKDATDKTKAVACFDLGEFAKYSRIGKQHLDGMHIRERMAELMQDPKGSAELKKEAITCYQKILMDASWSSTSFA